MVRAATDAADGGARLPWHLCSGRWRRLAARFSSTACFGAIACRAPVVVVGNITVGGTGKTPLVIALARCARGARLASGIDQPRLRRRMADRCAPSRADANADDVGDEPLLLARSGFPVWIGVDRSRGGARAAGGASEDCDVLICDDGLQHYALARDVEIAVVDASRGMGNGLRIARGTAARARSRLARSTPW